MIFRFREPNPPKAYSKKSLRYGRQDGAYSTRHSFGQEAPNVHRRKSQPRKSCCCEQARCGVAAFSLCSGLELISAVEAYTHPLILGVWTLLSLAFVHVMDWWPSSHPGLLGILGYLKPLPAFASMAVPIMVSIDW